MTKLYLAKYSKLPYIIAKKQSHFFLRNNVKENYLLSLYSLPVCYLSEVIKCEGKTLVKGNYDTSAVQSNKAAFILLVSWSRHLPCAYLPHSVHEFERPVFISSFSFSSHALSYTKKAYVCFPCEKCVLGRFGSGKAKPWARCGVGEMSVEIQSCELD